MLPIILSYQSLIIYSYPLFMGIAWGLSLKLCQKQIETYNLQKKNFLLLFWSTFIIAWVGSKLAFILFSSTNSFYNLIQLDSFWLGGGFVFYGGLIFGILNVIFFTKILKIYPIVDSSYFLGPLAMAHALGRIGCFLAGCCYGTITNVPWSVMLHGHHRHPVQLYEAFLLLFISFYLNKFVYKKHKIIKTEIVLIPYLFLYSFSRFIVENFRGDTVRGLYWYNFSTSQITSIFIIISIIFYIFIIKLNKRGN
jgi:phosphatidylglycerol---prolipoprotein diacylglyceryl transferase